MEHNEASMPVKKAKPAGHTRKRRPLKAKLYTELVETLTIMAAGGGEDKKISKGHGSKSSSTT
ncbi:unnamed protein product, partial [Ilex paraguariensis]